MQIILNVASFACCGDVSRLPADRCLGWLVVSYVAAPASQLYMWVRCRFIFIYGNLVRISFAAILKLQLSGFCRLRVCHSTVELQRSSELICYVTINYRARNLWYFGSKCYHVFSFAAGILMWQQTFATAINSWYC